MEHNQKLSKVVDLGSAEERGNDSQAGLLLRRTASRRGATQGICAKGWWDAEQGAGGNGSVEMS